MARFLVLLFALCAVPSFCTALSMADLFVLRGYVFCDTCLFGFETTASTPVADALVRVECRNRSDGSPTYTKEAVTGTNGHYKIHVHGDRHNDVCDAILVKSRDSDCSTPLNGRDRARVILTRNNGMASNERLANSMGFVKNTPLASCTQILQQYQDPDAEED